MSINVVLARNYAPFWILITRVDSLVLIFTISYAPIPKITRMVSYLQILEQKLVIAYDPGHQATNIMRQKRLVRERRFAFDASFGPSNTTEEVYEKTTKNLIEGVAEGYNSTCFAYGATGSGKTYTMLGTEENPGLMVLTLRDLYKEIAKKSVELKREYRVTLTYVEIYNEFIRDLLAPPSATGIEYLDLREDPIRGNTVAGVSEHEVCIIRFGSALFSIHVPL